MRMRFNSGLARKAFLFLCAFLLCLLSVTPEKVFPSRPTRQKVLFLDDGLLDFDRPQDYPPISGSEGMFGSLLDYLNLMGFSTERTNGPFTEEKLRSTDILVVINSFHEWTTEELQLVNHWVRSGGALLVLGDHTDLGGMNKSLNPLLSQFGARVDFETGEVPKPILRHGWRLSYRSFLLPARYYSQIYWGTGGTLTTRLPFEPMLEGAYAFGDTGDYSNNSYFGNRSYDAGEKAGDITLAAVAEPGRGKVMVCADTSPFLNGTIHLSFYPFVYNLFRWLQNRSALPSPYLLRWLSSLLMVSLLIYSWRSGGTATAKFVIMAIVLGLFAARYVSNQSFQPARQDVPFAVLDLSHLPKWATDPFQRHSVDGMATVLLRSGYLPVTMWEFDPSFFSRAGLIVMNEPASAYDAKEKQQLFDWVKSGGLLIVGGSYETPDAVNDLVQSLGLQLQKVPIGSAYFKIDYFGSQEFVHLPDTAPITYREGSMALVVQYSTTVLAENEGYPVAVRVTHGRGRILLLASARFLSSESLQDDENSRRGVNVVWLKNAIADAFLEGSN